MIRLRAGAVLLTAVLIVWVVKRPGKVEADLHATPPGLVLAAGAVIAAAALLAVLAVVLALVAPRLLARFTRGKP